MNHHDIETSLAEFGYCSRCKRNDIPEQINEILHKIITQALAQEREELVKLIDSIDAQHFDCEDGDCKYAIADIISIIKQRG